MHLLPLLPTSLLLLLTPATLAFWDPYGWVDDNAFSVFLTTNVSMTYEGYEPDQFSATVRTAQDPTVGKRTVIDCDYKHSDDYQPVTHDNVPYIIEIHTGWNWCNEFNIGNSDNLWIKYANQFLNVETDDRCRVADKTHWVSWRCAIPLRP